MKLTEDIQSLTAFRANVAGFVDQVPHTGRPLVLTQHGRGAAVLLGAAQYEALMDELELLRDIQRSELQLEAGESVSHEDVLRDLRERIGSRRVEG
jgi:prevent-host-death family protein